MRGRRKTVKISEAEWSIMKVLWEGCERTGRGLLSTSNSMLSGNSTVSESVHTAVVLSGITSCAPALETGTRANASIYILNFRFIRNLWLMRIPLSGFLYGPS